MNLYAFYVSKNYKQMKEIKRNFDILDYLSENPETVGKFKLAGKENGKWKEYSINDYQKTVRDVSLGLLAMGYKPGDKICTISNNRPEWNFMEMGIAQAGMIHVPVHPTLSEDDFVYILNHCEAKMVLAGDAILYKKISGLSKELKYSPRVFCFNNIEDGSNWREITKCGIENRIRHYEELMAIREGIAEEDLLCIIYTSGTTGAPKGVMLSHKNLMTNAIETSKIQHLNHNHRVLSFLPLSHVFEHMVNYQYHYLGVSIYYAESINTIGKDINELQVDGFIAVPRLLESVFDKIIQKARKLSSVKRYIFFQAVKLAQHYQPYKKMPFAYRIRHAIADKLVFSKWREALSKNITFIGCGGSALQPRLTRIFWAAGLPVFEGYGLTETSPVVTVNYSKPGNVLPGSVGPVLNGVKVKIAADGEILVKGDSVMMGYFKDDENTQRVIDKDGWFHTGDIGEFEKGKFLKITDRKKEIFKMSNGKYIAPQPIENKLKESFYIQQTMVIGENQKYPAAIILPNFQELARWCEKKKIQFKDHKELINIPTVVKHFQEEIKEFNKKLGQNDQIKKIILIADDWSPVTGELSSSLKLKRQVIIQKYKDLVDSIYQQNEMGVVPVKVKK